MENSPEKSGKTKETKEEMMDKAADIIRSGKFVVKGFGPDEGQLFVGKDANLLKNGMITVKYSKTEKDNTPGTTNVNFVSTEEFLEWQKLKILMNL